MEVMFLINVMPLNSHKTLTEYCKFLMNRFVLAEFWKGCKEIHVIFDNPGELGHTPKFFEQRRRDQKFAPSSNHYCDDLLAQTKINASKWRESILNCRECKRRLVTFLGKYLLHNTGKQLRSDQTLYVAGCFDRGTAWYTYISCLENAQPEPLYHSNAEETDTRIWLHAKKTIHSKIHIMSPDTDVYHIGLPMCFNNKEIMISLSAMTSREQKTLNLNNFKLALQNDPDLAGINELLPKIMETLYIVSGCDYVSVFSHISKSTFLKYFFQYSTFITSGTDLRIPGTLADTRPQDVQTGFLSFLRLIGTVYFKKNSTGFSTNSPQSYFNSCHSDSLDTKTNHFNWLKAIRTNIWDRTKFEDQMIPSNDALFLHWRRTCWISNMWEQADRNIMTLDSMIGNGWLMNENEIEIQWDTDENKKSIKERLCSLLKDFM